MPARLVPTRNASSRPKRQARPVHATHGDVTNRQYDNPSQSTPCPVDIPALARPVRHAASIPPDQSLRDVPDPID